MSTAHRAAIARGRYDAMVRAAQAAPAPRRGRRRCPRCETWKIYDVDNTWASDFYIRFRGAKINPVDRFRVVSPCKECNRRRQRAAYASQTPAERQRTLERARLYAERYRERRRKLNRERRRRYLDMWHRTRRIPSMNRKLVDPQEFYDWLRRTETVVSANPDLENEARYIRKARQTGGMLTLGTIERVMVAYGDVHEFTVLYGDIEIDDIEADMEEPPPIANTQFRDGSRLYPVPDVIGAWRQKHRKRPRIDA